MPAIQGSSDKMFFENAHIQHPRQYHKFFLRSRPYRGELPAVAGKAFPLSSGWFKGEQAAFISIVYMNSDGLTAKNKLIRSNNVL